MKILIFVTTFFYAISAQAQTVAIPDVNFEQRLIDLYIDSNGLTGDILISDTVNIFALDVSTDTNIPLISDLTGIEAFLDLNWLNIARNQITNLDLSSNTYLRNVYAKDNLLESIDVSQSAYLAHLNIENNNLMSLNITQNPNLLNLFADGNNLEMLDVTQNPNLEVLDVGESNLQTLNVLQNPNLTDLVVANNNLQVLDITQNPNLKYLEIVGNNLATLDVTQNPSIIGFFASNNNFETLDLTQNLALEYFSARENNLESLRLFNTSLTAIDVRGNNLVSLNIKSGNNANIYYFDARDNSSLLCIQVDSNMVNNPPEGRQKDEIATYSNDCGYVGIEDKALKDKISVYPNPVSDILHINLAQNIKLDGIKVFDVSGKRIFSSTETTTTVDFSPFQAGIYFIEISCNNERIFKKVMK